MKEWAVGLFITLIYIKVTKLNCEGLLTLIMLTVFPYGLGLAIYELIGWLK